MKPWIAVVLVAGACQSPLDTDRTVDSYRSFGDAIYREACQRIAYTGQLDQRAAGTIDHVDVSGALGRGVCVAGAPPPADAPPRLGAIVAERGALTVTVDAILPQPLLSTLEGFLERILPLYDDGTVERAIAGIGALIGALHDDPDVAPALARLGRRHGYRPASAGLVHALVEYPELDDFLTSFLGLVGPGGAAEPEWRALIAAGAVALHTAAPAADPAAPERSLALALDLVLARHPDLVAGAPHPAVVRDVRGLARVATVDGAMVAPFVDRDGDGLADADAAGRFVDAQGAALAVPSPFAEPGQPGAPGDPAPRDAQGRALTAQGGLLYQYTDLDGTLLIGALREAPTLLDEAKDTALGLVWGGAALLGPRAMQTRTYRDAGGAPLGSVTYNGFDTGPAPALDLLHAFVQVLGAPDADQVLQATGTLLAQHESATSRVIGAMLDAADRGKLHPEAQVPATSTIYDELAPIIARTLRVPGLADDLVTALGDPHVRGVAPMIARLMTATNQLDFNHTDQAIGAARGAPDYDLVDNLDAPLAVDRGQPDVDYNRSLMQRIAHLIHDASGAPFCNKDQAVAIGRTFARCKLFKIDDLAVFFALNMASDPVRMDATRRATTYDKASFREQIVDAGMKALIADTPFGDTALQGLVKVNGFTRFPTPKALSRALFLRPGDSGMPQFLIDTTDPLPCHDGDRFIDVHDKSIFAWELPLAGNPSGFADDTFFDAVRPLVDAFARHDECVARDAAGTCTRSQNAVKIFVDLLAMLHEHWASPRSSYFGHGYQASDRGQPRFAFPDNVVSFEPLVAEVLGGDLAPALLAFAPVLASVTRDGTPDGTRALPALIAAMRYVFDPEVAPAGLAYRSGATSAVMSDGRTPVARVTPFYLLGDAFAAKRAALAALDASPDGAMQAGRWRTAASALVDQVLTVDHVAGSWQLRNRRFHAMTELTIDFLRGRLAAHAAAGDLDAWIHHDLTADLTDKLAGPVFAALGDLTGRIEHDAAAHARLYGLLRYLVDEAGHGDVFATGVTLIADQLQLFLDDRDLVPLARAIGVAIDPATGVVDAQVALIQRSHALDADHALLTILRNLFRPGVSGVQPASDLADVVSALDRTTPGPGGELAAGDEAGVLAAVRDFFVDEQRGFLRFVAIVRARDPGAAR